MTFYKTESRFFFVSETPFCRDHPGSTSSTSTPNTSFSHLHQPRERSPEARRDETTPRDRKRYSDARDETRSSRNASSSAKRPHFDRDDMGYRRTGYTRPEASKTGYGRSYGRVGGDEDHRRSRYVFFCFYGTFCVSLLLYSDNTDLTTIFYRKLFFLFFIGKNSFPKHSPTPSFQLRRHPTAVRWSTSRTRRCARWC